jgi:hypothetical protein
VVVKVLWVISLEAMSPPNQQWHQLQVLHLLRNHLLQRLMRPSRLLLGLPAKPITTTGLMVRTLATSLCRLGHLFLPHSSSFSPTPLISPPQVSPTLIAVVGTQPPSTTCLLDQVPHHRCWDTSSVDDLPSRPGTSPPPPYLSSRR